MTLEFVGRFVWHIVVGAVLFAIVAGVATALWFGTVWLENIGVSYHIWMSARLVTELLWALDILCFVLYMIGQTIGLLWYIVMYSWR